MTLPSGLAPGIYDLIAKTDADGIVAGRPTSQRTAREFRQALNDALLRDGAAGASLEVIPPRIIGLPP